MKFETTITKKDMKELNGVLVDMDGAEDDDESPEILRQLFYVTACGGMREWDKRDKVKIKRIE